MITGIHHIALVVRDLDAAVRYYTHVAGMRLLPPSAAHAVSPDQAALISPDDAVQDQSLLAGRNGYLKILLPRRLAPVPDTAANPINRPGIRHFCVQNHDCASLEAAVLSSGGSLIAPPLDLGTGNQYAYARDPEGNIMEIEGLPYAPKGKPTWMGHVAIVTPDIDAAVAFYLQLLGNGVKSRGRFGPAPQFDRMGGLSDAQIEGAWLIAGNMQLELWEFHAPAYRQGNTPRQACESGYSHVTFEVKALDQVATRLVALGGELLSETSESDRLRSVLARDIDGNRIELLEFRGNADPLSIAALAEPGICEAVEGRRSLVASRQAIDEAR